MSRFVLALALAALLAVPVATSAQVDRRGSHVRNAPTAAPSSSFGLDLVYAQPEGELGKYVNGAGGIAGHCIHALDAQGIIAFRAELGYLIYRHTRLLVLRHVVECRRIERRFGTVRREPELQ